MANLKTHSMNKHMPEQVYLVGLPWYLLPQHPNFMPKEWFAQKMGYTTVIEIVMQKGSLTGELGTQISFAAI